MAEESTPVTLQTLWEAVNSSKNELLMRLTNIDSQITQIHSPMNGLNEQISEVQIRVSAVKDNVENTDKKVQELIKKVEILETKVDYMENKSRQNNVVIFGVAEGEEKNDMVAFIKHLLSETLSLQRDFPLHIERAHRISAKAPGGKRPIIVKFGDYQHKAKVMKSAREKEKLLYKGTGVSIYPDFSAAVLRKRQLFTPVKKKLNTAGIRYAMLFPATLSVDYMGTRKRFETPLEVQEFLNSLDKDPSSPMT